MYRDVCTQTLPRVHQPAQASLGSSIATKNFTNIYRFGVALNDFPRQQDPATTTLDDACVQVHHTADTSMIDYS